jgi:trehalose 6-phosphate synthase/phosphatase
VLQVLEHFADRTPGSLIEEKEYSLVWHYAMCEPEFGEWLANELMASLDQMLAETELRPQRSRKSIEVRPTWARKSVVLGLLGRLAADADFQLAVGDDRTDEELFERLPPAAFTVHVGDGQSLARYRLSDSLEVKELLSQLAQATGEPKVSVA